MTQLSLTPAQTVILADRTLASAKLRRRATVDEVEALVGLVRKLADHIQDQPTPAADTGTTAGRIDGLDAAWRQTKGLTRGRSLRVVLTDSESADGIAYTCADPAHPDQDTLGTYDCCDPEVIHTHREALAVFFVTAANAMPHLLAELKTLQDENLLMSADAARGPAW